MRKLIYFLIPLLLFGTRLFSQTYSFQHIGVEDGLAQSVITSINQDKDGVFWIGTMSGLTRYDGSNFDIVAKEDGLAENWVTSSLRDQNGNLWFGHWGGGVSFYDVETGSFQDMKFERFSNFKTITDIVQDKDGDIWFSTSGAGVFKYESKDEAIISLTLEEGFLSDMINAMVVDQQNNIWFASNLGIVVYQSDKSLENEDAYTLITSEEGLSSDHITDLIAVGKNSIYASSEFEGVSVIKTTGNPGVFDIGVMNDENILPSNEISCLYKEDDDNIWIGSRDKGVFRYNLSKNYIRQLSTRQGLNYFKVNNIFRDREDNVWIGTDLGLNLFRGDEFLIYDERDGLANNVIWAIAEDKEERIWLGTDDGVSRLSFLKDTKSGQTTRIEVDNFGTKDGLSNPTVLSLYISDNGNVWCGTGYGGVTVLDSKGNRTTVLDTDDGLASNTIYSIARGNDGTYWLGTDKGASQIKTDGEIVNYTSDDGLGGDNIYKIFKDDKGNLYFASIGGYLSVLRNGKFEIFNEDKNLSQKFITSITGDNEGNVWFGAYGGGIYKFDGKEFTNYSTENGLSSNSPYSLVADDYNNIWVGHGKGIDKFNTKDLTTKRYREKEGFLGVEPNPNSVWKDHDGNLWFGTIMGAVKFNLSLEKQNATEPITILENIKVNYEPFEFPLDNEFSYDENHITFHYIGISLTNPEHVEYMFMLDNFDRDWSPVTKEQDVVYSNLPPGDYEFRVKASNNDGKWNELPTSYTFTIKPPFWMTWWFYTICGILIVVGLYVGDKIRMRKLKADKERLERIVDERTAEVVEQKNIVEDKNREIMDSIKYARRIQHAILPPIPFVQSHFSDSFVLYKPKDVVAGDFYYCETIGDNIYIASADCTGHGVPGAMVSVVCANALNRAIKEMQITEPAAILDKTRELVLETFEKSEKQVNDGMDLSFCKINLKTRKMTFTGANNPVYRITPLNGEADEKTLKNDDFMLLEYKGDKQPIGDFIFAKPFTQTEVQLKKGDKLYLSTDGFADQFGGDEGRKFMYTPFKKMFLNIHTKKFSEQEEEIVQIFDQWRGSEFQIDDICILGLEIK